MRPEKLDSRTSFGRRGPIRLPHETSERLGCRCMPYVRSLFRSDAWRHIVRLPYPFPDRRQPMTDYLVAPRGNDRLELAGHSGRMFTKVVVAVVDEVVVLSPVGVVPGRRWPASESPGPTVVGRAEPHSRQRKADGLLLIAGEDDSVPPIETYVAETVESGPNATMRFANPRHHPHGHLPRAAEMPEVRIVDIVGLETQAHIGINVAAPRQIGRYGSRSREQEPASVGYGSPHRRLNTVQAAAGPAGHIKGAHLDTKKGRCRATPP